MKTDTSRYSALMREWAARGLDAGRDARAFVQTDGPTVNLGAAAARRLLEPADASSTPAAHAGAAELATLVATHGLRPVKFTDTFGFSRPVYYPLLVHLHLRADAPGPRVLATQVVDAARRHTGELAAQETPMRLWWSLCLHEAAEALGDDAAQQSAIDAVDAVAGSPGDGGTLHARQGLDDLLDAWTFRELAGLHALAWMAIRTANAGWRRRVREITAAHQLITQPDYTTYQPWGVYAFLLDTETVPFGEQQLHDAVTNLHVEPGGAGLITGLLLADAAAALSHA